MGLSQSRTRASKLFRLMEATDKDKASWLMMTMDITSQELFERDYKELIPRHQNTVLVTMIENRDFKGL